MASRAEEGVILEFFRIGRYVKVSAVDTKTGTEVSIVGDPMRGEAILKRTAIQKLKYVMNKAQNGDGPPGGV